MKHYDVFLSHANADKLQFIEELKKSFDELNLDIFYDKDVIKWGDEWKKEIKDGIDNCDVAVIVISENFYDREWTEIELYELLTRKAYGKVKVLPLLYKTTSKDVFAHYPKLKEIQFLDSAGKNVEYITIKLAEVLLSQYKNSLQKINSSSENEIDDNTELFDAFCNNRPLKFIKWLKYLIDQNNDFIDDYDEDFVGWQYFSYKGNPHKTVLDENDRGDKFRMQKQYFKSFVKYFDKYLKDRI